MKNDEENKNKMNENFLFIFYLKTQRSYTAVFFDKKYIFFYNFIIKFINLYLIRYFKYIYIFLSSSIKKRVQKNNLA
jgi:hypothetical protein